MTPEVVTEKNRAASKSRTLPKSKRLRRSKEFVLAQKTGKRVHSKHFILVVADAAKKALTSAPQDPGTVLPARIGITVTKKCERLAVRRNRIKRMVREVFRHLCDIIKPGKEIIVIAKTGSADLSVSEVRRQLIGALKFNGFLE